MKHLNKSNLVGKFPNRYIWGVTAAMCFLPVSLNAERFFSPDETTQSSVRKITVTGNIVDETGMPLIGVAVQVKGTTEGTVTDFDGNFSLSVSSNSVLVVSYLGYTTKEIQISGKTQLNIKLEPDTKTLDEVVVVGYGTVKKRDLTGAVTSIKGNDITLNPGNNPLEALQGKVAGLDITRTSGQAGAGVSMQLRGTRSFTADGTPTFIIDGMPGDYSTLNPNDIESIEVLKDASSTAIYGSSGANGVIIITTKSGKEGKTKIDFNAFVGVNGWSTIPQMRTGETYMKGIRDAAKAAGQWSNPEDDKRVMDAAFGEGTYALHQKGAYIDWARELMQTGLTQNYSLSVSGGTEKTKAYISFNFSDENGQYKNDNYKLYSSNIRIDHKIKNWLSIGANSQMSYVHQNKAYANFDSALRTVPIGELYNEDGSYKVQPSVGSSQINLLLNNSSNYRNNNQNYKLYFNPYIELKPVKGLSILSRIGATLDYTRTNYFQGIGSYQYYRDSGAVASGTNQNVYAQVTQNRNYNYKWENIITYNIKLNNVHDITLTGVTSWNHDQYDQTIQKETNISDNSFLWHNMGKSGDSYSNISSKYTMSKGFGIIGRINYSYLGKYLLSASIRHDGSSRLAKNNRWDNFPAISAGWRISDEKFMKATNNWLDNLKLRAGWGITGTANIAPYSSLSKLEQGSISFGNNSSIYKFSQTVTNTSLGWEKSYNTNLGVDMSVLRNRLDLTADFYWTKTKGVIWKRPIPVNNGAYSGSQTYEIYDNICETQNRGFEMTLNTRNIDTKDFKWNSTLTFNWNHEEIISLSEGVGNNIANENYALSIGEPIKSYYNYKIDGIWQKDEIDDAAVFGAAPGDLKINVPGMVKENNGLFYKLNEKGEKIYYDANNKYTISSADYQILGHNSPDWTLGLQNTFTYKNFDLSIFMYMRWGQMIKYKLLSAYDPSGKENFAAFFNYWTEDNPSNDFPAINANKSRNSYVGFSALEYVNGSFFKIKNITLGYTLPKTLLTKAHIEKCRFYATITNPLIIAKSHLLKDYDPEMNGDMDYPLTKQLVFGVNLSF